VHLSEDWSDLRDEVVRLQLLIFDEGNNEPPVPSTNH
jgi:hypothetical protein